MFLRKYFVDFLLLGLFEIATDIIVFIGIGTFVLINTGLGDRLAFLRFNAKKKLQSTAKRFWNLLFLPFPVYPPNEYNLMSC